MDSLGSQLSENHQLSASLEAICHMNSSSEDQLSASLEAIRHMDSSSEESTTENTTTSSSDDCCCSIFKKKMSERVADVYTISSRVQQQQPTWAIPEIRVNSLSPPSDYSEQGVLGQIRRRRMMKYRDTQLLRELSVDPSPQISSVKRFSVNFTGFPITQPEVNYIWLTDICSEFEGFKALHVSPLYKYEIFAEFST